MTKVNAAPLMILATLGALAGCGQAPAPTAPAAIAQATEASSLFDRVTAKASYDTVAPGSKAVYASLWFLVNGPTGKPSLDFNDRANDNVNVVVGKQTWETTVYLGKNRSLYIKSADGKAFYAVGTFGPATPTRDQAVTFKFASGAKLKVKDSIRTGNDFPPLPERHVALQLTLDKLPKAEKVEALLPTQVD